MTTGSGVPPKRLKTKSTINITIKRKNKILAIPVAADATPQIQISPRQLQQ
ncbi:hypothetical protein lpa_03523 [Legionella pneumophila 2300/99 Alcoy]|nr:hypothetical protein lpa_03523 [Legionella pneumophila 2300/99 Alcoy]